jgi:serine/threonine-protein kinase RsbW
MKDSLTISCSRSILRTLRAFTREVLERLGLPEVETNMLVLAVDEICSNLIIHAHNGDGNKAITVTILHEGAELVFEIRDQGSYFDFTQYVEPTLEELKDTQRRGGMGLMLVSRIMDTIHYFRDKDGHNVCRLTKNLN